MCKSFSRSNLPKLVGFVTAADRAVARYLSARLRVGRERVGGGRAHHPLVLLLEQLVDGVVLVVGGHLHRQLVRALHALDLPMAAVVTVTVVLSYKCAARNKEQAGGGGDVCDTHSASLSRMTRYLRRTADGALTRFAVVVVVVVLSGAGVARVLLAYPVVGWLVVDSCAVRVSVRVFNR